MPGQLSAAVRVARRATPLAIEAYRRWERLTPAEKERYKQHMRGAAERARAAYEAAVKRGGGGFPGGGFGGRGGRR